MSLEFTKTLDKFIEESEAIQKMELDVKHQSKLFHDKFFAWLKEQGLAENFTLPMLMRLGVNKSREQ